MHDSNQQLHQDATGFSSPASRVAAAGFVSLDTSESSPGMSSTGNEDLGYSETKGDSGSFVSNRTRCTSLSSPGQPMGLPMDKLEVGGRSLMSGAAEPSTTPFGSLPTSRRLQQLHPIRVSNSTAVRSMLSPSYGNGGSSAVKQPSPSKLTPKQRTAKVLMTKMEEARSFGVLPMSGQIPLFSGGGFSGGLSSSLPGRMAPGDFIDVGGNAISEMEADDGCFRLSESGESKMQTAFKTEPMMSSIATSYPNPFQFTNAPHVTTSHAAQFNQRQQQPTQQQQNWNVAKSQSHCPTSTGCQPGGNPETSPSMALGDELQFDPAM